MWARTRCPFSSSTRNIAFGRGSTTRPSTSIAPSFLAMSSAFRDRLPYCRVAVLSFRAWARRCSGTVSCGRHDGTGASRRAETPVYVRPRPTPHMGSADSPRSRGETRPYAANVDQQSPTARLTSSPVHVVPWNGDDRPALDAACRQQPPTTPTPVPPPRVPPARHLDGGLAVRERAVARRDRLPGHRARRRAHRALGRGHGV